MYEKIVVPLDGSKLAEAALPYAEEIAARMGSDIIALSVIESKADAWDEKSQKYIKKIVDTTKYHVGKYGWNGGGKAIEVDAATIIGYPAEKIVEYASDVKT